MERVLDNKLYYLYNTVYKLCYMGSTVFVCKELCEEQGLTELEEWRIT